MGEETYEERIKAIEERLAAFTDGGHCIPDGIPCGDGDFCPTGDVLFVQERPEPETSEALMIAQFVEPNDACVFVDLLSDVRYLLDALKGEPK